MKHAIPFLLVSALPVQAQGILYDFAGMGHSVAGPGDVDGDGVPDLLVRRAPMASNGWAGRVELRSGASGALIHALEQIGLEDGFGHALTGLGDIDGDGHADFALSAPRGALIGGSSFVRWYSGASGQLLRELVDTETLASFGFALAGGEDLDGDGLPDLIIGTPRYLDDGNPGRVELIHGQSGAVLRVHHGTGPSAIGFGSAVAFVGDLDLDGRVDYAVGSGFRGNGNALPGALTVFSGASGAVLHHLEVAGLADAFGASITALDDLDGDGVPDLVVGSPGEFQAMWVTGAVRVISGASGAVLHHVVTDWNGIQFGSSVVALGDVDGDGLADFGAHFPLMYIGGVLRYVGSVEVHSGADGSRLASWTHGYAGPVVAVGDVNGDGAADLLIAGGSSQAVFSSLVLGQAPEVSYTFLCPPQTNSAGCTPWISWTGGPSIGTGPGLSLHAESLIGQQRGLFVYGPLGTPTPFGGGTLCVAPPYRRTPLQWTNGAPGLGCDGSLSFTFDGAFLVHNGHTVGSSFSVQAWSRDPGQAPAQTTSLSNDLYFTIWP